MALLKIKENCLVSKKYHIAVIGLGYVGLPVALAFSKHFPVIGYDINENRITELNDGKDSTFEFTAEAILSAGTTFTNDPAALANANIYIVTVPTPIDHAKQPDFSAMIQASREIATYLQPNDIVIYESTVYPGAIEEICKPILEKCSTLQSPRDFHIGYSPERINPGDKIHTFDNIVKVVSGDCPNCLADIAAIYETAVSAGVHKAPSIKVAEMAKVIENTQRDINIALMNELAMICHRLEINTNDVLAAARTKWNFLDFKPGLVGGHCIGVDPYYLTYKAQQLGHHPEVILAGRRINDNMGQYVAEQTLLKMIKAGSTIKGKKVAILGFTFKENCHDTRNTKVIDIIRTFEKYGIDILLYAPHANPTAVKAYYGYTPCQWDDIHAVDALVIAVAHDHFKQYDLKTYQEKLSPCGVIIDLKNMLKQKTDEIWSL